MLSQLMFSQNFPCALKKDAKTRETILDKEHYSDLVEVSNKFSFPFGNIGYSIKQRVITTDVVANCSIQPKTLGECLDCESVPDFCYKKNIEKFKYLKGAKRIQRTAKNGHIYT